MAAMDGVMGALRGAALGQGEVRGPAATGGATGPLGLDRTNAGRATGGGDFGAILEEALAGVDAKQRVADDRSLALVSGQDVPIHEVMAAVTEAELAVQMTTALATKAIAAYQEIWRMEV